MHPATIVAHEDPLLPAFLEYDRHVGGVRIDSVLDELLQHAGRALDDLTRGNPVDHLGGKNLDPGTPSIRIRCSVFRVRFSVVGCRCSVVGLRGGLECPVLSGQETATRES